MGQFQETASTIGLAVSDDNGDRRDHSTRDMAIEARVLVNQHMTDCARRWDKLETKLVTMTGDIKSLGNRVLLIIGGLIVTAKALDWAVPLVTPLIHH